MNIRIKDYTLTSDPHNFILSEIKLHKEGVNVGKEYVASQTYHPSLENALYSLLRQCLLKSDATTLTELLTELKQYRKELRGIWNMNVKGEILL